MFSLYLGAFGVMVGHFIALSVNGNQVEDVCEVCWRIVKYGYDRLRGVLWLDL